MAFNAQILLPEVQDFIETNLQQDIHKLLLRKSPFENVSVQELAQQIKGRQVARKKFSFLNKRGVVFPVQLSLEQASSEATASFKAKLVDGKNMADLTAGFGIDAYFISQNFDEVTLVEQNAELISAVRHNWKVLGRKADFFNGSLEDFLKNTDQHFDLLYLDPARRDNANRKKFLLEDLSPNLLEILPALKAKTKQVMVKLSPLIDISYLVSVLDNIAEIYIISVRNEAKEVVLLVNFETVQNANPGITAVNLETSEPDFVFNLEEEKTAVAIYNEPLTWLYLPNSSVLKAGAFNLICERYNVLKLHANSHIYSSEKLVEGFPGRVFRAEVLDPKNLRKGDKFNIVARNYPLSPAEIKKKYKISDGGTDYLIFTQGPEKKYVLKATPQILF